jgi:hypothetical protein
VRWRPVRWYDDMMIMTNKADDSNNNNNNNNSSSDVELLSSSLPLWNEELAVDFAAAEKKKIMLQKEKNQNYKARKVDSRFEIQQQ